MYGSENVLFIMETLMSQTELPPRWGSLENTEDVFTHIQSSWYLDKGVQQILSFWGLKDCKEYNTSVEPV